MRTPRPCRSSVTPSPVSVSVKMSPHDKGDSFIERQGAAATGGTEPSAHRGVDWRRRAGLDGDFLASAASTAGSISSRGSCCPGAREPRATAGPHHSRRREDLRYVAHVSLRLEMMIVLQSVRNSLLGNWDARVPGMGSRVCGGLACVSAREQDLLPWGGEELRPGDIVSDIDNDSDTKRAHLQDGAPLAECLFRGATARVERTRVSLWAASCPPRSPRNV